MAFDFDVVAQGWLDHTLRSVGKERIEYDESSFELDRMCYSEPEHAWEVIDRICSKIDQNHLEIEDSVDQKLASNLGAGPIESLLVNHGERFIERIESKAKTDPVLRWCLACLWQNEISAQVWDRAFRAGGRVSR